MQAYYVHPLLQDALVTLREHLRDDPRGEPLYVTDEWLAREGLEMHYEPQAMVWRLRLARREVLQGEVVKDPALLTSSEGKALLLGEPLELARQDPKGRALVAKILERKEQSVRTP